MARTPAPDTRDRILGAAARLFYEHGVRAVGMNRIIQEAGTGKNLLYQHFPEKADLVAAYLAVARDVRDNAARLALVDARTPADTLVALVAEVAAKVAEPGFRGCAFRNYLAEFPDDADAAPTRVAQDYLGASRAAIDAAAGEVDPSGELAERVWLLVDGLYFQAAYRNRLDGDVARAGAAAVRLVEALVR